MLSGEWPRARPDGEPGGGRPRRTRVDGDGRGPRVVSLPGPALGPRAGPDRRIASGSQGWSLAEIDYRLVLDAFADAVVAADSTHRVVYVNAAAERLLG